jgi:RsiW-degrading membrane proteinase PrsW (M82 family)
MGVGRRLDNKAFTIVVAVVVALCALPVLALLALSAVQSPVAGFLALLAASIPVAPLVGCYLWLDRYEPEPRSLLALGLGWGAVVAVFATLLINGVGGWFVPVSTEASTAIWAPVTEEAAKGFFLLLLLWWRRDELDGILDGIVYAGMVGIGFAFTENILYLAASYTGGEEAGIGGFGGLTATFVVRCLFSPFAHPFFTGFTGVAVGIAVTSRSRTVRWLAPAVGYVLAVIGHAAWNSSTLIDLGQGVPGFVIVYVLLMFPAFVGMACLAVWARVSERKVLTVALHDASRRGLIPATDIGWLVDLRARRHARLHARRFGGAPGERAMKDYQQAAIELGFLHHRYLRGTPPPDFAARGQEYVARIGAVRPFIAFPGQVVPTR